MSYTARSILTLPAVVGNGMIAQRFRSYLSKDDVVIFASGVSNSKETRPEAFYRERQLIDNTLSRLSSQLLVYFSTTSVYDPTQQNSLYIQHKVKMEHIISSGADKYLIVRTSNLVGGVGNPYTVFNYFWNHIHQGKPFTVWKNAIRNLLDIDDLYEATDQAIVQSVYHNQTCVIANPHSVNPVQIVEAIEQYSGKKGIYEQINNGTSSSIETHIHGLLPLQPAYWQPDQYISRLLVKYYQPGILCI